MSKDLEALNRIENEYSLDEAVFFKEDFNQVRKSLKALEIIKEKNVSVAMLKSCVTVERYNTIAFDEEHFKGKDYARKLTQEEFNLLKELDDKIKTIN